MTDSKFQPGTLVWYASEGFGRVQEVGESMPVLFWKERKSGTIQNMPPALLTPLASYIPEAEQWSQDDSWKKFESGIKKAPLTLVALAMQACGGSAAVSDIREKLDKQAPIGAWGTWWKRTEPKLRKLPDHFGIDQTGKGDVFTLRSRVANVPRDWKATLDDWKKWLLSNADELPPEPYPADKIAVAAALTDWPEHSIEQALSQTLAGANQLLQSPRKPTAAAALSWMDAVGSATLRLATLNSTGLDLVERSGETLLKLSQYIKVKAKRKEFTLFWVGALTEAPDRQSQLEQQRQEQERQHSNYDNQLEEQRQEQNRLCAEYDNRLERQRQVQECLRAAQEAELKELRTAHAAELERERQEQERLRQQARDLDAELRAKRQESRLEIRKDMLLAIGEVLQIVARHNGSIDELSKNVEAGLTLALRAGGAELLDDAPRGTVVAPGVIVRGGDHGDLVLLPAKVKHEAG